MALTLSFQPGTISRRQHHSAQRLIRALQRIDRGADLDWHWDYRNIEDCAIGLARHMGLVSRRDDRWLDLIHRSPLGMPISAADSIFNVAQLYLRKDRADITAGDVADLLTAWLDCQAIITTRVRDIISRERLSSRVGAALRGVYRRAGAILRGGSRPFAMQWSSTMLRISSDRLSRRSATFNASIAFNSSGVGRNHTESALGDALAIRSVAFCLGSSPVDRPPS